jgi:large subunit ribosomal protein L25
MSKHTYEVAVIPRTEKGTSAVRRARTKGLIPAVIYSKGNTGEMVYVKASEWEATTRHDINLLNLKGEGIDKLAVLREVQINHLKNQYVHIDFNEVHRGEKATSSVAVRPRLGDIPAGVNDGGILQQDIHELEIICLPTDMPDTIEVAIAGLGIGESLLIKDLELPAGVETHADPEAVVFHIMQPKLQEATAEESAAEPAVVEKKKKEQDGK